jgi:hypothetical protein
MALDNKPQERLATRLRRIARNKRKLLALLEEAGGFELMLEAGMPRDQLEAVLDWLSNPMTRDEIAELTSREVPGSPSERH